MYFFRASNAILHVNKIQTADHNHSYMTKFIAKLQILAHKSHYHSLQKYLKEEQAYTTKVLDESN